MFFGSLTIAINGFSMVFGLATIALNGFQWFWTIGQTMRWFRWIVMVYCLPSSTEQALFRRGFWLRKEGGRMAEEDEDVVLAGT